MVRYNNIEGGEGSNANRHACAACRHQRRKCKEDCVLAPYFPMEKTQQYLAVHKVFGFSNMTKILSNLVEQERKEAVESFQWEAMMWQQDPVQGPLGAYKKLCDMINNLLTQQAIQSFDSNLMKTHDLLGFNNGGSNEAQTIAVSNNGVPPITNNWGLNNFGQSSKTSYEKSLVSHSQVFRNEVEESKVLRYVADPNALFQRDSSLLQHNYIPSLASVATQDITQVPYSNMAQPNQNRVLQYSNGNMVNKQGGIMMRRGQGTEGNVENIYYDGHGVVNHVENGVIEANSDHAMAQNRGRSQITGFQHFLYQLGHDRIKQDP
ncbi:hypothetical protein TanjilG_00164 [Lupinus angustifolius]|uniref:LOB domain-containing protein n=1 Tax=Lupinus angustifolius TaxID=3871 RepID=A0A1J7G9V2_LUPAN|nr:PREDICTED: LOB domain-containing protein 12-like [Lupinus angustifolius]OIV97135.1 hypothetical protein TanjilG_00164 [Lupinus angustifolius]